MITIFPSLGYACMKKYMIMKACISMNTNDDIKLRKVTEKIVFIALKI